MCQGESLHWWAVHWAVLEMAAVDWLTELAQSGRTARLTAYKVHLMAASDGPSVLMRLLFTLHKSTVVNERPILPLRLSG
jgi:hypothetical protein